MKKLGNYVLDSLQIFFPWDDDFYTYMKEKSMGTKGPMKKAIPVIYSDNTKSTVGKDEAQRRCILNPKLFGTTCSAVGWTETKNKSQPIIPSEKPEMEILLNNKDIIIKAIPKVNGKNEYHLEYSNMSSFGPIYSNWVAFYLPFIEFQKLAKNILKQDIKCSLDLPLQVEEQQAQREEMDFIEIPVKYHEFSLSEFEYAKDYLKLNGFNGKKIASLVFDSNNTHHKEILEPIAKIGILHTTGEEGFDKRKPQFVIKISQSKKSICKRNKSVKAKGIIENAHNENKIILDFEAFYCAIAKLVEKFREKHPEISIS